MDEKGFLLGMLTKTQRIFNKHALRTKKLIGNIQDGNREWITILATVCADGTALALALIYKAVSSNLQDTWLQDFDTTKDVAFFASSPTGWTNDELGMNWLTNVFDRQSKGKARNGRDWRLLFVDGHGSHINLRFVNWCIQHHILIAVYPPHSTHRLQPLDVALFSPLAVYYSQELDRLIHDSEGICHVAKRDFYRLFKAAFARAFTEHNIQSAWARTGLYPFDPSVILRLVAHQLDPLSEPPSRPNSSSANSALSAYDWRRIRALIQDVVANSDSQEVKKLQTTVLHITTENIILKAQAEGFKRALYYEQKKRTRGKQLFEELRALDNQGSTFYSPAKIQQAFDLQAQRTLTTQAAAKQKEQDKAARLAAQQTKAIEAQERRDTRAKQAILKKEAAAAKKLANARVKESNQANKQLQQDHQQSTRKRKRQLSVILEADTQKSLIDCSPTKKVASEPPRRLPRTKRQPKRFDD